MPIELESQTIVIAARRFNPAILGEHWIITRGVFTEDELTGNRICTPVFSFAQTEKLELNVVPERLQLKSLDPDVAIEDISAPVLKVVRALPETPYLATGINFKWKIIPDHEEDVEKFARRHFRVESGFSNAIGESAVWGAFSLSPRQGGYLTTIIRPALEDGHPENPLPFLMAELNFHFDARGENSVDLVIQSLNKVRDTRIDSQLLMSSLLEVIPC